jgi:hypothetical protein
MISSLQEMPEILKDRYVSRGGQEKCIGAHASTAGGHGSAETVMLWQGMHEGSMYGVFKAWLYK